MLGVLRAVGSGAGLLDVLPLSSVAASGVGADPARLAPAHDLKPGDFGTFDGDLAQALGLLGVVGVFGLEVLCGVADASFIGLSSPDGLAERRACNRLGDLGPLEAVLEVDMIVADVLLVLLL